MRLSKQAHSQRQQITTGRYGFQKFCIFLYFIPITNDDKSVSDEITNRIKNRVYYAYKGLNTSKLLYKQTKSKIYMTLISPG
jgi:hypothetical protein